MSNEFFDCEVGAVARTSAPTSIAERMKAELAARKQANAQVIELRHDAVPELTLTCRVPTDGEEISDIVKNAERRAKKGGSSSLWFNRLLIARFTTAIEWHGELLESTNGVAMTFASREFQELVDAPDAGLAVSALYASDAYVGVVAENLMTTAGFGNESAVEVVDPTQSR
jgi:hypothetical protein